MRVSDVWAVVVARTGPTAKSRLSRVLTPGERQDLARAMLRDVLRACSASGLAGIVVVTETEDGRALARSFGAHAVADPGLGLNAAIRLGIASLERGVHAALVLPGDVPLIEPSDIQAIVESAEHARVAVLVPDTAGVGTNALLLRPPRLIEPAFGLSSAQRHAAAARAAGHLVQLELPRLALDVDEPDALAKIPLLAR